MNKQQAACVDDARDLLRRLETMQPPNGVLQQITMLGEAAELLRRFVAEAARLPVGDAVAFVPLNWKEEWSGSNDDIPTWRGVNPLGVHVDVCFAGKYDLQWHREAPADELAAKKAEAEAEYQRRVLTALTDPPVAGDAVRHLHAALLNVVNWYANEQGNRAVTPPAICDALDALKAHPLAVTATPAGQDAPDVTAMVNRFLCWKLPEGTQPDGTYPPRKARELYGEHGGPTGTNLLSADGAKAMFLHCLTPTERTPQRGGEFCGWSIDRVPDPPFPNDLMQLTSPAGDTQFFEKKDAAHVWRFLAALSASAARSGGDAVVGAWDGEVCVIDGRRYSLDVVRAALLGLASDLIALQPNTTGEGT